MDEIHTVTVLNGIGDKRCVGWFRDKDDAVAIVLTNEGNIQELRWEWAVVECCAWGTYSYSRGSPIFWAHWEDTCWEPCARPDWAKKVVGFGIG